MAPKSSFESGIEQSGGLEYVSSLLFNTKKDVMKPGQKIWKTKDSIVWVLVKFTVPVAIFSAFLANIPLVAMMIPPIVEYSKKVLDFTKTSSHLIWHSNNQNLKYVYDVII